MEAVQQWHYFLLGKNFKAITDQRSISYVHDNKHKSKIKNDKISRWRVELPQQKYDIVYHPSKENVAADVLSHIAARTHSLKELHDIIDRYYIKI